MPVEAIIVAEFGQGNILANQTLARIALKLASIYQVPIFAQPAIPLDTSQATILRSCRKYTSTLEFVFSVSSQFENRGHEIVVVAAPMHVRRVAWDLQQVGMRPRILPIHTKIYWYSPDSAHWQTRNAFFWWSREIPLRILRRVSFHAYQYMTCVEFETLAV